jgi:hypothetical protein
MHLDHLSFAAGPEGLEESARRLGARLGATFRDGGFHPRFGTRNKTLPLTNGHYLELVAVLDHPAADKVPFGQAVEPVGRGGGWLGWVVAVDDLGPGAPDRPAAGGTSHCRTGCAGRRQLRIRDRRSTHGCRSSSNYQRPSLHPSMNTGRSSCSDQARGVESGERGWVALQTVLRDIDVEWTVERPWAWFRLSARPGARFRV